MDTKDIFELNLKISERMWKFVSVEADINPALDDIQPVSYENAHPGYRALCRTLAWVAMEEFGITQPENNVDSSKIVLEM